MKKTFLMLALFLISSMFVSAQNKTSFYERLNENLEKKFKEETSRNTSLSIGEKKYIKNDIKNYNLIGMGLKCIQDSIPDIFENLVSDEFIIAKIKIGGFTDKYFFHLIIIKDNCFIHFTYSMITNSERLKINKYSDLSKIEEIKTFGENFEMKGSANVETSFGYLCFFNEGIIENCYLLYYMSELDKEKIIQLKLGAY